MEINPSPIASRLRLAREQAGLSQGQVAKMIGLHRPTISEIEAGRRKVSTDELRIFAKIYDVSIEWMVATDNEGNNALRDRIHLAARELAKLKEEDLDRVLQLLSALRKKDEI